MARYLLIEVDDNEMAGDLVAAIQDNPQGVFFYKKKDSLPDDKESYQVVELEGARVRALFGKPVNFCECPPSDRSLRGQKFGWYVCADCGKAKKGACQHPRNLLDPIDMPIRDRDLYLGIWEGGKPTSTYGAPGYKEFVGKRGNK